MDRIFLDANVLFSAVYTPGSRLLVFWSLDEVELVTSLYALEEARRNLVIHNQEDAVALDELASKMTIVAGTRIGKIPDGVELADKDIPILLAAIDSGCSHLLTGDRRHFDAFYNRRIAGVMIQTPAEFLRSRKRQAG